MLKKFINSLKPKYIGIHISEGQLSATELNQGTIFSEDISTMFSIPYWQNPTALRIVLKKAFKTFGFSWIRPQVLISVPPDISDYEKLTILEAIMQAGASRSFIIEEIFITALGAGVYQQNRESALCKKIYLLVKKEISYLGIVFAGSALLVRVIPKGYEHLSVEDLLFEVNQLVNRLTPELPQQFKDAPIPKEDLGLIENAWQTEIERRVYITVPWRYKGLWGNTIDEFQMVYTEEGEEAANKGLNMYLPQLAKEGFIVSNRQYIKTIKIILMIAVFIIISVIAYWAKR